MEDVMAGKILVVDDDATNRELLQEFLVAEGLEVVTAPDGRSSLEGICGTRKTWSVVTAIYSRNELAQKNQGLPGPIASPSRHGAAGQNRERISRN